MESFKVFLENAKCGVDLASKFQQRVQSAILHWFCVTADGEKWMKILKALIRSYLHVLSVIYEPANKISYISRTLYITRTAHFLEIWQFSLV